MWRKHQICQCQQYKTLKYNNQSQTFYESICSHKGVDATDATMKRYEQELWRGSSTLSGCYSCSQVNNVRYNVTGFLCSEPSMKTLQADIDLFPLKKTYLTRNNIELFWFCHCLCQIWFLPCNLTVIPFAKVIIYYGCLDSVVLSR